MGNWVYVLRYDLEPQVVDAIYSETEIAKRFEEVMEENKEIISNRIVTVRKAFIHLLEEKKEKELESRILNESSVRFEVIKESAKFSI